MNPKKCEFSPPPQLSNNPPFLAWSWTGSPSKLWKVVGVQQTFQSAFPFALKITRCFHSLLNKEGGDCSRKVPLNQFGVGNKNQQGRGTSTRKGEKWGLCHHFLNASHKLSCFHDLQDSGVLFRPRAFQFHTCMYLHIYIYIYICMYTYKYICIFVIYTGLIKISAPTILIRKTFNPQKTLNPYIRKPWQSVIRYTTLERYVWLEGCFIAS